MNYYRITNIWDIWHIGTHGPGILPNSMKVWVLPSQRSWLHKESGELNYKISKLEVGWVYLNGWNGWNVCVILYGFCWRRMEHERTTQPDSAWILDNLGFSTTQISVLIFSGNVERPFKAWFLILHDHKALIQKCVSALSPYFCWRSLGRIFWPKTCQSPQSWHVLVNLRFKSWSALLDLMICRYANNLLITWTT